MERSEFVENYKKILKEVLWFSVKYIREGLLAMEEALDNERVSSRDIFMYGMRFSLDGTELQLIDKILSNIVNQEKDAPLRLLKTIQKEAVLSIHEGHNPRIIYSILNSYTDIPYSDEEIDESYRDKENE
jgi:flagellar motor component MotA